MVVRDGNLTVELAEDVARYVVDLTQISDVGHWLHLAYAWDDGGMSSTLWLNGTSVAADTTTTTTTTTTTSTTGENDTSATWLSLTRLSASHGTKEVHVVVSKKHM